MKSLKHYFSSPPAANKEQKDVPKEPLQSSQNIKENITAKVSGKESINGVKEPKKKKDASDCKSKKSAEPKASKNKDPDDLILVNEEEKKSKEVVAKLEEAKPSSTTPKSNAFQLMMSQKKPVTPEGESEKKKKSLSLGNSKKTTKEQSGEVKEEAKEEKLPCKGSRKSKKETIVVEKKDDEESPVEVHAANEETKKSTTDISKPEEVQNEKVQPRRSRQAKDKANKSLAELNDSTESDKKATRKGRKSNKQKQESNETEAKSEECKNKQLSDRDDEELFRNVKPTKRKWVVSSDEDVPKSPKKILPEISKKVAENKESSPKISKAECKKSTQMEVDEVVSSDKKSSQTARLKKKVIDLEEVDSEDDFVKKKGTKRKKAVQSGDETPSSPTKSVSKVAKNSIAGYFAPISREEALKRAASTLETPKTQTIKADVHPEPVGDQKRRSMGPAGRAKSSRSPKEDDAIEVLESIALAAESSEEDEKVVATSKKSPAKIMMRKKRLWELRVKLLSPAKSISEMSSVGDNTDSSSSDSDLEVLSPAKHQINKTGWGAGGKLAPIFLPRNKNSPVPSPLAAATRKIFQSSPMAPIRAAPTEHTIGFADEDPDAPISALHPSIGHVGQFKSEDLADEEGQRLLRLAQRSDDKENLDPPKPFDLGPIPSPDAAPAKKKISKKKARDCESWCEKYKPKLADAVAGNERSVNRLRAWLEGWTESKTAARKLVNGESDSSADSMDDFIVSEDDDSNQGRKKKKKKKTANTVLLVGPSGCGKTASVYAIAEELGFKVLEVNASSKRSGKRILAELREATQSHQVRSGVLDQDSISNFFGKGKNSQGSDSQPLPNSQSLSLILIEDVDIIFEEQDEGFVAALNSLAENSKRPLVLVSNDPNCSLVLTRQHRIHFQFEMVPVSKSVDIIEDICQTEGEEVDCALLKQLVIHNSGDLRSTLHAAQFFAASGGFRSLKTQLTFPLSLDEFALRLQTKPLPFIVKLAEIQEADIEECPQLNKTWGNDSDSDKELFKDLPFKSKIVNKIRSKLLPKSDQEPEIEVEKVSVPLKELEEMANKADKFAALDVLTGNLSGHIRNNMLPGLSDQPTMESPSNLVRPEIVYVLAKKIQQQFSLENIGTEHWEQNQSWHQSHTFVDRSLTDLLPISDQLDHKGVSLDYLPILRELGKCEQSSMRSSRRSTINCLQGIGMQTDQFVLDALPYIFS